MKEKVREDKMLKKKKKVKMVKMLKKKKKLRKSKMWKKKKKKRLSVKNFGYAGKERNLMQKSMIKHSQIVLKIS